jgi:hypothetical protein
MHRNNKNKKIHTIKNQRNEHSWIKIHFGGTWIWTQALALARQVLYCLIYIPSHFFTLVIFQVGSQDFFPGWPQTEIFLSLASYVAGTTGAPCYTWFFLLRGGLPNFLWGLALNHCSPDLCFTSGEGYGHKPQHVTLKVLLNYWGENVFWMIINALR